MISSARTRSVSGHSGHWRVLPPFPVQGSKIVTAIPAPDLQIAHLQLRGLGDTRPGVVEKEQKRVFAAAPLGLAVGHGEHGLHFRLGQPSNRRRQGFLRCDGPDMTTPFDMGRVPAADEAGKCADSSKPLIAGTGRTLAILLEMCEELQHQLGGKVAHGQPIHGLAQLAADERQQQAEGVP